MSTHIISVRLGLTGSGKTLDQTEGPVLDAILRGEDVWCSYWLNLDLPNIHYFKDFEEIRALKNAVVVFDEVTDFFDPRAWMDEGSEVRRWFRLHRHRHLDIYCNTQDISLVAKTIGILAHEWLYCKPAEYGPAFTAVINFLIGHRIRIKIAEMTYQELKKMAVGFDIGEQIEAEGGYRTTSHRPENLEHRELDDYKIELIHRYCNKCGGRQGEMIRKKETEVWATKKEDKKGREIGWELKNEEYCPKHKEEKLELKYSGIYDTDYDPPVEEKEVEFRPFVPIKEGAMMVPYKGALSDRQVDLKKAKIRDWTQH